VVIEEVLAPDEDGLEERIAELVALWVELVFNNAVVPLEAVLDGIRQAAPEVACRFLISIIMSGISISPSLQSMCYGQCSRN
jgi:hypothetical protein